jgi:hypothetical protein
LFTIDNCVGNAGIVWVDGKGCLVILEVSDNFFVEEEGALEESYIAFESLTYRRA